MTKRQDPEGMEIKAAQKHASFNGKDILEIGCGDGRMTFKYAGKARRVVAIDPLADSINMAKRGAPKSLAGKLEFHVGCGERLTFPDRSFDMVFFTWSLCCADVPSMGKALDEAWRVLKRGGRLINLQPSLHQPFRKGAISYLIQKKFGTSVDDERYAQSRRALKYASLVEQKFFPIAEEEFTVNTCFETVDEALDDFTRDRKEQYSRLDPKTKTRNSQNCRFDDWRERSSDSRERGADRPTQDFSRNAFEMNRKHARYGPPDRYLPPPGAGMCISVFAVVKRGTKVLVGVPKRRQRWTSEWISGWLMYSKKELDEIYGQTRLPSSYLLEGEHPDHALLRVMRDQLGIEKFSASAPRIISYNSPSDWYPGNLHWDLVFVYEVKTSASPKERPWWRELAFLDRQELRRKDFGWNEDMMKDLGLV